MLVRVAISRYILDGTETDVSQAVCSLWSIFKLIWFRKRSRAPMTSVARTAT